MTTTAPTMLAASTPEPTLSPTDSANANTAHLIAWIVAGCFVVSTIYVSVRLIFEHLRNFTEPAIQRKIVGILWMVPIYATTSWFSLKYKDAALYLDLLRDMYEAYVIYLFLALMICYLGGPGHFGDEERVVAILDALPPQRHPPPLGWCVGPAPTDRGFLRKCKLSAMQFIVAKPTCTLLAIVCEASGVYNAGEFRLDRAYAYLSFVVNCSITYAFYWLVMFYLAFKKPHLTPYKPVPKFICIKSVLFLSFWQSVLMAGLAQVGWLHGVGAWTTDDVSTGVQDLLICVEMFGAALAHRWAFSAAPYAVAGASSLRSGLLSDHLAVNDAVRDFNEVMPGRVLLPAMGFKPSARAVDPARDNGMELGIAGGNDGDGGGDAAAAEAEEDDAAAAEKRRKRQAFFEERKRMMARAKQRKAKPAAPSNSLTERNRAAQTLNAVADDAPGEGGGDGGKYKYSEEDLGGFTI